VLLDEFAYGFVLAYFGVLPLEYILKGEIDHSFVRRWVFADHGDFVRVVPGEEHYVPPWTTCYLIYMPTQVATRVSPHGEGESARKCR